MMKKTRIVNVRLAPEVHDDFRLACELRGASMSALLHQFIFRVIREERDAAPSAFEQAKTPRTKTPSPGVRFGGTVMARTEGSSGKRRTG